jgi:hypothetical protein
MSASEVYRRVNAPLRQIRTTPMAYDNKEARFCKEKILRMVYKDRSFVDNRVVAPSKNKQEARLQELILSAKRRNIHVRTEKLLREAGYRAKSGSCRVKGQDVILIDRDARIGDQIDFLASELAELENDKEEIETLSSGTPEN